MFESGKNKPGKTQSLVIAQGFIKAADTWLLVDHQGVSRVFFELSMDPDHQQSDPQQAYQQLLGSLAHGTAIRLMQIQWPDPKPRGAFLKSANTWVASNAPTAHLRLHHDLVDYLSTAPLPYFRRTILEIVVTSPDTKEWIATVPVHLANYGITAKKLFSEDVQELAHFIFNPGF